MSIKVHIIKDFPGFSLKVDFESDAKNIALLGPSGSGKSLTLKCIAGIIKPDCGYIELNGRVLFDSENHINLAPQKRKVGYLFQSYALFPNMSVKNNILMGLHSNKDKEEKLKILNHFVKLLNIEEILDNYPHEISGGQAQRVALARILVSDPEILLLDEPFSALDAFLRNKLQMELKGLLKKYNKQTILVSHDRDEAYLLSNEIVLVDAGTTIVQKDTKELFKDPIYLKAAILSGCKNFSKIEVIDEHKIHVVDWGFDLKFKKSISSDIKYIGIRAHYFSKDKLDISEEIEVMDITEETFNNLVRFRFKNQDKTSDLVYWKVDKDIKVDEKTKKIYFNLNDILLLKWSYIFKQEKTLRSFFDWLFFKVFYFVRDIVSHMRIDVLFFVVNRENLCCDRYSDFFRRIPTSLKSDWWIEIR